MFVRFLFLLSFITWSCAIQTCEEVPLPTEVGKGSGILHGMRFLVPAGMNSISSVKFPLTINKLVEIATIKIIYFDTDTPWTYEGATVVHDNNATGSLATTFLHHGKELLHGGIFVRPGQHIGIMATIKPASSDFNFNESFSQAPCQSFAANHNMAVKTFTTVEGGGYNDVYLDNLEDAMCGRVQFSLCGGCDTGSINLMGVVIKMFDFLC
mmetsp:Transcript_4630/g.6224  ORF Transcript_4630/g.6224 Transcript_4630/m.6224 type:complete len:211 (+) Transcript_4630:213-845(+)